MLKAIVTENNPAVVLARVVDQSGSLITQSSISSIVVTVYNAETSTQTGTSTPSVASTVFNTLVTNDPRWTSDTIGYNLAVDVDGSFLNVGDTWFQAEIAITPVSGEVYRLVSLLKTRAIFG